MQHELKLVPGARYRVVREGATLSGWRPIAPYSEQSWRRQLHVGEIIRYDGLGYSGGSDGIDIEKFTPEELHHDYETSATFRPTANPGNIWITRPDPSFLEGVD